MGSDQTRRHVGQDRLDVLEVGRTSSEALLERLALVTGHRDVELVVPLANLVDRRHAGMVQRARRLRLTHEARARLRILRDALREKLQRHRPAKLAIRRAVDDAHAALAEAVRDGVVVDRLADHHVRRVGRRTRLESDGQ